MRELIERWRRFQPETRVCLYLGGLLLLCAWIAVVIAPLSFFLIRKYLEGNQWPLIGAIVSLPTFVVLVMVMFGIYFWARRKSVVEEKELGDKIVLFGQSQKRRAKMGGGRDAQQKS